MPTIRLQLTGPSSTTIVMRTAISISGVTRLDALTPRGHSAVTLFRTSDDAVSDRGVSDYLGRYVLSPRDGSRYYVVASLTATSDSTLFTCDMSGITSDASGQTQGVTVRTLVGV